MPARLRSLALLAALLLLAPAAQAYPHTFGSGSLIVPLDVAHQDNGMFRAYGLVYELLHAGVPVEWVIAPNKPHLGVDFTATATDVRTGAAVTAHDYRGGPFVIDAADAARAQPIVDAWLAANAGVNVHRATAAFDGDVRKQLVAAPTIAVFADGNEIIAFGYLNAAGIPDSRGHAWPTSKLNPCSYTAWPDVLCPSMVAGTMTAHNDGRLFDSNGTPAYCQMMSMHWAVTDAQTALGTEVVAEYRSFLQFPTHLFAECQAVNAIENNVNGHFLTPHGFVIGNQPSTYDFYNDDVAFAQQDGTFASVGGSEPSYTLPSGDSYLAIDTVMISGANDAGIGVRDVWMTGYVDGRCQQKADTCLSNGRPVGKVSYLAGHKYGIALPISRNPSSNGTRLFLNSLFEADCGSASGQPEISFTKSAPEYTADATVTYTLSWYNGGLGVANSATISDVLPAGATFVSASGGGTLSGSTVTWSLGNIASGARGTVTVTVSLAAAGMYPNQATMNFLSGTTPRSVTSNTASSAYGLDQDNDGLLDADEVAAGTDPHDADSDDDGVSDGDEVNVYHTDPLAPDSDGDGLQDGTELGYVLDCASSCFTPPRCATSDTGNAFVPDPDCSTTSDPNNPADPGAPSGTCGNARCDAGETCGNCPGDCGTCPPPARCGDGTCNGTETCSSCARDCGACSSGCGNGACEAGETCGACASDCGNCPGTCGDGICDATETCSGCAAECGACGVAPACGDGTCATGESCATCSVDCGACTAACGNGVCEPGEACDVCPADCGGCSQVCGDGICDARESCSSCARDCGICPRGDAGADAGNDAGDTDSGASDTDSGAGATDSGAFNGDDPALEAGVADAGAMDSGVRADGGDAGTRSDVASADTGPRADAAGDSAVTSDARGDATATADAGGDAGTPDMQTGGCGCAVPGGGAGNGGGRATFALLALGALAWRRRRAV